MEGDLLVMVALVGGAALVPFVGRKFMVPSAVLEIVYGALLFAYVFEGRPEWFSFFKEVGLIYLMFIAGMELDMRPLLRGGRFLIYLAVVIVGFVLMPMICVRAGLPFYLGIVVSVVSAGVVITVLKETDLLRTRLGADVVGITLTGEFFSILVLTVLDVYHRHGFGLMALVSLFKITALFASAVVFLRVLYLAAWWKPERVEKVMNSEDPVEEGIRAVIFVAFTGALLAFQAGVEPLLGSFIAGAIFSYVFKSKGTFEAKINAIGFGFFIPLFFIGVGADFDLSLFYSPREVLLAIVISGMVLLSNMTTMFWPIIMRATFVEAIGMTLLISSPLSMMIVAGTIGVKSGFLKEEMLNPIVLASIISTLLYPMLFRPLVPRFRRTPRARPD